MSFGQFSIAAFVLILLSIEAREMSGSLDSRWQGITSFTKGTKNGLSVAHLNVQSLCGHFLDIKDLLLETEIDILTMSETWLNPTHLSPYYKIEGYEFHRKDSYGRGSGVAIYIKNSIEHRRVAQLDGISDGLSLDSIFIQITASNKTIIISSIYRSFRCHERTYLDDLDVIIQACTMIGGPFMLLGDTNINLLTSSPAQKSYSELLNGFDMLQHIQIPTRVTAQTATLIDHIITSNDCQILQSSAIECDISDHHLIATIADITLAPKPTEVVRLWRRSFTHYDSERF